jgi:phage terminase large subunit-like protein
VSNLPVWSTTCPDWADRIVNRRPLIPFAPLFPEEAREALAVMDSLRMVDIVGEPTMGEVGRDWSREFAAAIFGSYDKSTGRRLIRHFMELVAKKNAKSSQAAGIMMTALLRNWRRSAEFTILAPTKEIAGNSFKPAMDMVRADNELFKLLQIKESQKIIVHRGTGAELRVVAADSGSVGGKKSVGVLVDELWLFGKMAGASSMFTEAFGGLKSRPEGFVVFLTTQSDEPPRGVFKEELDKFRAIRDGKIIDNRRLPVLYEYPQAMIKSKAYLDSKTFYIPNPNLGASVDEQNLIDDWEDAKNSGPVKIADFLAKSLNIEIGVGTRSDGWAGAQVWKRGDDKTLTLETLLERSEVVVVSLDGGGLDDLLGMCVMGREKNSRRWLSWSRAFIGPDGRERRKANSTWYDQFQAQGDLIYVEELPDDVDQLLKIVKQVKDTGLLHCVGADPAGLGILVDALKEIDITVDEENLVGVKQGVALMGAIKAVERKLVDGTLKHSVQELMNWCAGNAITQPTPTGMRIVRDESGFGKIDPLMALMNCSSIMSTNPEAAAVPEIYCL